MAGDLIKTQCQVRRAPFFLFSINKLSSNAEKFRVKVPTKLQSFPYMLLPLEWFLNFALDYAILEKSMFIISKIFKVGALLGLKGTREETDRILEALILQAAVTDQYTYRL
jgi:hypothetical protein